MWLARVCAMVSDTLLAVFCSAEDAAACCSWMRGSATLNWACGVAAPPRPSLIFATTFESCAACWFAAVEYLSLPSAVRRTRARAQQSAERRPAEANAACVRARTRDVLRRPLELAEQLVALGLVRALLVGVGDCAVRRGAAIAIAVGHC
jgi:hypothetical protein